MKGTIALLAVALLITSCGEGTIEFGGVRDDQDDTVEVRGNVRNVTFTEVAASLDIVVFVFTDLEDPGTYQTFAKQRAVVLRDDAREFTVEEVRSGDLTIVFLQDKSVDPDRRIDPGDPVAVLDDDSLESVRNGRRVVLTDVDVDFAAGTAEADDIDSEQRPAG